MSGDTVNLIEDNYTFPDQTTLSNYINMIRKKYGEQDIPQAAMTQEDYDRINKLKAETYEPVDRIFGY